MTDIKDSGSRREFDTGAVRDIQGGKGRCDLLPLDVVCRLLGDDVMWSIYQYQGTHIDTHLYNALTLFADKYCRDIPSMVLEVSMHFEAGARKYGEYNWQKGIPINCYIDSAVRHYLKFLRGDTDEPHDRAFVWNLMCCAWEYSHGGERKGGDDESIH